MKINNKWGGFRFENTMTRIEQTKPVPGYEGLYAVISTGRVLSLKYKHVSREIELKSTTDKDGYKIVTLSRNGAQKTFKVHRLVAMVFLENRLNHPLVNHLDGNPSNNNVENLEWCSHSENTLHAVKTGLQIPLRGECAGQAKLTSEQVLEIKKLLQEAPAYYGQLTEIAKKYGVKNTAIYKIKTGKRWGHL